MRNAIDRLNGIIGMGLAVVLGITEARGAALEGLDSHKLTVRSYLDFGHLVNGNNPEGIGSDAEIAMLPLNRASVTVSQDASLDNFDVSVGITGLIWWPFGGNPTDPSQRVMMVKPMVPVARARWKFGEPTSFSGAFQVGVFPYKYNPDAKNLGEYLYRSGTYPGFLWTGEGWLLMNRSGNLNHGAMLNLSQFGGRLKHNFSLLMETVYYPVGDFSPAYDFSVTSPWLEVGGGVVFHHYLPLRPSLLAPKAPNNTYIRVKVADSADWLGPQDQSPVQIDPNSPDPAVWNVEHHWTHKGIKLMGRVALNLGSIIPEERRGPEDLRLFGEVAVLGWENQPLYYEERAERIPVMVGLNVPTFKVLDLLSLQIEYYKSRFNNFRTFNTESMPIPKVSLDAYPVIPSETKDDIKWSVYAKKSMTKALTVYTQVASDHFRLMDGSLKTSDAPLTSSPKEWYYLLRLEFALR